MNSPFFKVIGIRNIRYTKNDGTVIQGRQVAVTYEEDNVEGLLADTLFLSDRKFQEVRIALGDDLLISWQNRFKKIVDFVIPQ